MDDHNYNYKPGGINATDIYFTIIFSSIILFIIAGITRLWHIIIFKYKSKKIKEALEKSKQEKIVYPIEDQIKDAKKYLRSDYRCKLSLEDLKRDAKKSKKIREEYIKYFKDEKETEDDKEFTRSHENFLKKHGVDITKMYEAIAIEWRNEQRKEKPKLVKPQRRRKLRAH